MEVSFSLFCDLLDAISRVKPRSVESKKRPSDPEKDPAPVKYLRQWRHDNEASFRPRSGIIIFRLLFPEEDIRRRYGLKEKLLAKTLGDVLDIPSQILDEWDNLDVDASGRADGKEGCLGIEVQALLETRRVHDKRVPSISLTRVDNLLDELAASSLWSNLGNVSYVSARKPAKIIRDLYSTLSPRQAAWMTQIILKDLRPLLYPVPSLSTHSALVDFNSVAFDVLTPHIAMRAWHWAMPHLYRCKASLDDVALLCEQLPREKSDAGFQKLKTLLKPELGVPIDIPKAVKGSGSCCRAATKDLKGLVWAETKMDGERAQIHIDMTKPYEQQIQIFSKSHRDSTQDRQAIHPIIRVALGLPYFGPALPSNRPPRPSDKTKIATGVFEAEMTSQRDGKPGPFWRIQELKDRPGAPRKAGPTPEVFRSPGSPGSRQDSTQQSTVSSSAEGPAEAERYHLGLYFFDVLYLNGESLLGESYSERREQLTAAIQQVDDWAMLVPRKCINFDGPNADEHLRNYFAKIIADRQEGLVLKSDDSVYNDFRPGKRWIKLKKDYITGLGDTADFVVVGAGYDKDRNRELRVSTKTFTAWYVGFWSNRDECRHRPKAKPHFDIVLRNLSYGLSREELEDANYRALARGGCKPTSEKVNGLPYTFSVAAGLVLPEIVFLEPFVFEMMGAGFQRQSRKHNWELRWPRITKRYSESERPWRDAIDLEQLNVMAERANNVERSSIEDQVSGIWEDGMVSMDGYAADRKEWQQRLLEGDEGYERGRQGRASKAKGNLEEGGRKRTSAAPLSSASNLLEVQPQKRGRLEPPPPSTPLYAPPPSTPPPVPSVPLTAAQRSNPATQKAHRRRGSKSATPKAVTVVAPATADAVAEPSHTSTRTSLVSPASGTRKSLPPQVATSSPSTLSFSHWLAVGHTATVPFLDKARRCTSVAKLMQAAKSEIGLIFVKADADLIQSLLPRILDALSGPTRIQIYRVEALTLTTAPTDAILKNLLISDLRYGSQAP